MPWYHIFFVCFWTLRYAQSSPKSLPFLPSYQSWYKYSALPPSLIPFTQSSCVSYLLLRTHNFPLKFLYYPRHLDMEPNSRTESTQAPTPSRNWCLEQLVKGLNDDHLTIPDADLRGKWVVVTNVADPVAKEAAIQFASWGANVVLTGNTLCDENDIIQQAIITDCKTAALDAGHLDPVIEWMWCSGYLPSIELFAASWELKERPMDILVGNFWDYESANQPMFRKEATELFTVSVKAPRWSALMWTN